MRKIEQEMVTAIRARRNWKSGNTEVLHDPVLGGCEVEVRLRGNLIAKRYYRGDAPGQWQITLAGRNTPTTRSRLTALCQAFTRCNGVRTCKGVAGLVYAKTITGEWRAEPVIQPVTDSQWVQV